MVRLEVLDAPLQTQPAAPLLQLHQQHFMEAHLMDQLLTSVSMHFAKLLTLGAAVKIHQAMQLNAKSKQRHNMCNLVETQLNGRLLSEIKQEISLQDTAMEI
jgi:hypothetical protein